MSGASRLRGALAALAVLAVILGVALAPVASAQASGVAYLPPSVSFQAQIEKVILENYQVDVPAATQDATTGAVTPGTAVVDLSQYLPAGVNIEAVKVIVHQPASNTKITALDGAGNALATVDVIPLSSGFEALLPAGTASIQLENYDLNAVWSTQITVKVLSSIDVELRFTNNTIEIVGGQAIVPVDIVVKTLPGDGSLALGEDRTDFEVMFWDSVDVDQDGRTAPDRMIAVRAHSDPANPAVYTTDMKITTSAQPGTYTVKVYLFYYEGIEMAAEPFKVGELAMTVTLSGDGSGEAVVSDNGEDGDDGASWWKWVGLGAVAAVALVFLFSRAR